MTMSLLRYLGTVRYIFVESWKKWCYLWCYIWCYGVIYGAMYGHIWHYTWCKRSLNFFGIFHLNDQFRPMKVTATHLFAIDMRFCKFSVVSVFSNWLYSS